MNYYEHHIGDYIKDTAHLSMLEDSAYRRLIDAYYTRELPLPGDRKACQKLARAQSKDERAAVDYVLDEFFKLEEDGCWHQSRCDLELGKYFAKQPAAEVKKENAKERQRNARERRKMMFEELSGYGVNMPYNATTETLISELSRLKSQPVTPPVTPPVTRDNTCTQSPVPNPQSPINKTIASGSDSTSGTTDQEITAAARFAVDIRKWEKYRGKMAAVQAQDPRLQAWADAGVSDEQLQLAYEWAVADREANGDASPINAGFLDVFVAKVLKPITGSSAVGKLPPPKQWFMTSPGIEAKAVELGICQLSGEQFYQFKARVFAQAGITEEQVRTARIDAGERV